MAATLRFDVYGTAMLAEHGADGWRIFEVGADGKRREVHIAVPADVGPDEIGQYLDDIYHERATPAHLHVRRIDS